MTEAESRQAITGLVSAGAVARLEKLADLVTAETGQQNLIARSTVENIWSRHILDSVQLLSLAPTRWARWVDIGSGGGFPGLVVACASNDPITLVEPRALRARFLSQASAELGLDHVTVLQARAERAQSSADVISARAVASAEQVLQLGAGCATTLTKWLLPRGASAMNELDDLTKRFTTMTFHVEQSQSDRSSGIIVGCGKPQ